MKEYIDALAKRDFSNVLIAVDFDGTCVMHEFPEVGEDVPFAVAVLKALAAAGAKLMLWTMRSDLGFEGASGPNVTIARDYLLHAKQWFEKHDIPLYGLNENPQQKGWTESPKCYAHIYIDDAALGCPLVCDGHDRPYVDWEQVALLLIAYKL